MDRLRLEAIERRRQRAADYVQQRKTRLSQLYLATRFIFAPATPAQIHAEQDSVMAFLEQNDLEAGKRFAEETLPASPRKRHKSDQEGAQVKTQERSQAEPSEAGASEFLLLMVPNRLPEPIRARNPLAELYYTTQTLPVTRLLPGAHKTLTTDAYQLALLEGKLSVVHSRIEELKRSQKWSLRQHAKFRPPARPKVHWDHLLDEMRWLQLDTKEERKLKVAVCAELALAVQDFWTQYPGGLAEAKAEASVEIEMMQIDGDDTKMMTTETVVPASLLPSHLIPQQLPLYTSLADLNSASRDTLDMLPELPVFSGAPYRSDFDALSLSSVTKFLAAPDLERGWQRFLMGEADSSLYDRLNKNSAQSHDEAEVESSDPASAADSGDPSDPFCPRGLFAHSHRRGGVRAPVPPPIKNLECRTPTLWFPHEDQTLLRLAKELLYNWTAISVMLASHGTCGASSCVGCGSGGIATTYAGANVERKTPWHCFQRWLQLNPTFSLTEIRGPHSIAAQKWLADAAKFQAVSKRRIFPVGVPNDSPQRGQRRLRWASMFDAFRKVMRRRETTKSGSSTGTSTATAAAASTPSVTASAANSTALAAGNAAAQRATIGSAAPPDGRQVPTPRDLARLKLERDRSTAELYARQRTMRAGPLQGRPLTVPRAVQTGQLPQGQLLQGQLPQSRVVPTAAPQASQVQVPQPQAQMPQPPSQVSQPHSANARIGSPAPEFRVQGSPSPGPASANAQGSRGRPNSHIVALMDQIARQHPDMPQDQIQRLAQQHIQRYMLQMRQSRETPPPGAIVRQSQGQGGQAPQ